jgi:hypothetical protein
VKPKEENRNLASPDWRENPADFSSGDLEGKREQENLIKPKRFAPKKNTNRTDLCFLKFI